MKQLRSFHHAFYELLYAFGNDKEKGSGHFKRNLRGILKEEFGEEEYLIDFVTQGEMMDTKIATMWAIRELKKNREHLNEREKQRICRALDHFVSLHPEAALSIDEFKKELGAADQ